MTHQFDDPDAEWSTLGLPEPWEAPDAGDIPGGEELVEAVGAPSLPIILFSAACGIAGGVLALFVSLRWLDLPVEFAAATATLGLLFALGISGAVLSAVTGSRAAPVNILFSCGLILVGMLFLALCLLVGALVATLLV